MKNKQNKKDQIKSEFNHFKNGASWTFSLLSLLLHIQFVKPSISKLTYEERKSKTDHVIMPKSGFFLCHLSTKNV